MDLLAFIWFHLYTILYTKCWKWVRSSGLKSLPRTENFKPWVASLLKQALARSGQPESKCHLPERLYLHAKGQVATLSVNTYVCYSELLKTLTHSTIGWKHYLRCSVASLSCRSSSNTQPSCTASCGFLHTLPTPGHSPSARSHSDPEENSRKTGKRGEGCDKSADIDFGNKGSHYCYFTVFMHERTSDKVRKEKKKKERKKRET